jgi:arylsulfatase A
MLMTGKYPHHQGYWENQVTPRVPYFRDPRHLPLLRMVRQAGYRTGFFGKVQHGNPEDMDGIGADTYLTYRYWEGYDGPDQGRGGTGRAGMYGVSWYWHPGLIADGKGVPTTPSDFGPDMEARAVMGFAESNKNRPFFAYWPTNLPHMAYDKDAGTWNYTGVPGLDADGKPTGGRVPGSLASTMGCLDSLVGSVVQKLESLNLAGNTIIIFLADNGTAGPDKGKYERDVALRVPFVVTGGPVRNLGPSGELVNFADLWPTIADLAGYEGPRNCDGHSFAPLLLGRPWTPRGYSLMAMNNARWIRDDRWLLDGQGRFWDVDGAENIGDYKDVTLSTSPGVAAARRRLQALLDQSLPLPDYNDPLTRDSWRKFRKDGKGDVKIHRPGPE